MEKNGLEATMALQVLPYNEMDGRSMRYCAATPPDEQEEFKSILEGLRSLEAQLQATTKQQITEALETLKILGLQVDQG